MPKTASAKATPSGLDEFASALLVLCLRATDVHDHALLAYRFKSNGFRGDYDLQETLVNADAITDAAATLRALLAASSAEPAEKVA